MSPDQYKKMLMAIATGEDFTMEKHGKLIGVIQANVTDMTPMAACIKLDIPFENEE